MTVRAPNGRLIASVSFDLDNLWSYLKTYGDPEWQSLPTYLPVVVPRLLDLFDSFGLSSTVFVVGQDAEVGVNDESLASITAAGHEVGNHSFHHEPWLHEYSRQRIVDELARTEDSLARVCEARPVGFRGPGYSLSPTLLEVLTERDYLYDATTLPTWIGPLARQYYFRTAHLDHDDREQRARLFGQARDGLRPIQPYQWRVEKQQPNRQRLVELPVTTLPLLRVPIHFSYVLYVHSVSPALARTYFRNAMRACSLRGVGPSLLLHPLDLLDGSDAPGVGFFPGMGLSASEKRRVIDQCLVEMTGRFDVGGVGRHAAALVQAAGLRVRDSSNG